VDNPVSDRRAFLSYVSEDDERVDALEAALVAADIKVWRDKRDIEPGVDWEVAIRRAIQRNSVAFIACFSEHSDARDKSYQYEELAQAVDEARQRPPARAWLFPVRFADVELPPYDLGGGKDLDSLHRSDLFGPSHQRNLIQLVRAVAGALQLSEPTAPRREPLPAPRAESRYSTVRRLLRDPNGDLELEELLQDVTDPVVGDLKTFGDTALQNRDFGSIATDFISRIRGMDAALAPLLEVLVQLGQHAKFEHLTVIARTARSVSGALPQRTGNMAVLNLLRYPSLVVLYAVAIAAVSRGNWPALRTVAIDAKTKGLSEKIPLVGYVSAQLILDGVPEVGTVLRHVEAADEPAPQVVQRYVERLGPKFHTPISDHLHDLLRPLFARDVTDDHEFTELFDRTEVMLDLLILDLREQNRTSDRPSRELGWLGFGAYTWRDSFTLPVNLFREDFAAAPDRWEPLQAGLFGGQPDRASRAWDSLTELTEQVARQRRF
jgi:hypothetical protein